ncbi:MAG: tetratricopeptide repeat protein [Phycisphaerae bacterium]|nr:tetratricopeptide repeat protein [Phycisphaerae bacterium]
MTAPGATQTTRLRAQINVTVALVLVAVILLVTAGFAASYFLRRLAVAREALSQGRAALDAGDWEKATPHLRRYLTKYPNDTEWLARYAEANLRVRPPTPERVGHALGAYRRLFRLKPDDRRTVVKLATLYRLIRDFNEMAYVCREWLTLHPEDLELTLSLGKALVAQKRPDEARLVLEPLAEQTPHEPEVFALLSSIALQDLSPNGIAAAKQWLDEGIQQNPTAAELLVHRARLHQTHLNLPEAAQADLQAATQLQPSGPWVRLMMFDLHMTRGELEQAQVDLAFVQSLDEAALEQTEGEVADLKLAILKAAASLSLRQGTTEAGIELATRALAELQDFRWVEFLPVAVDLYLAGGKADLAAQAVQHYRQQLQLLPGVVTAATDHLAILDALVAAAQTRPYTVINLLEPVVTRHPRVDTPWKLLARAYETIGQRRRALHIWEQFLTRWPDDPEAVARVVSAYIAERRWSDALMLARKAEPAIPQDLTDTLTELKMAQIKARALAVAYENEPAETLDDVLQELDRLAEAQIGSAEVRTVRAFIALYQDHPDEAVAQLRQAVDEAEDSLPPLIQLADLLARLGRREQAEETIREAVASHPDLAIPRLALAYLLRTDERLEQAREVLEVAANSLGNGEKARVERALGRLLLGTADRERGINLLRNLAAAGAEDAQTRLYLLALPEIQAAPEERDRLIVELRRIEGERGLRWRIEQAKAWLRSSHDTVRQQHIISLLQWCMNEDREWAEPVVVLGSLYERIGQDNLAEDTYRSFFNRQPVNLEVADRLLALLQRQNRYNEAWSVLRRLPEPIMKASAHRAWIAIACEEYNDAIDALQMRVDANPHDAASRALLAQVIYADRRQAETALRLLDEALTLNPDLTLAVSTRVSILHSEGRDADVVPFLDAEVQRRNDFPAYLIRAEYHELVKRHDLAERDYLHLITFEDQIAKSYELLGNFYFRTGKPDEAMQAWETGLQRDPGNVNLQRSLIRLLLATGSPTDRQRGRVLLEDLLKRLPNDPELLYEHASTLLQDRRLPSIQEATKILERVVALDPQRVVGWMRLIDLARRQGDSDRVARLVASAMGTNPRSTDLLMAQAQIEKDAGRLLIARSFAQRVLEVTPGSVVARTFLVDLEIQASRLESAEKLVNEVLRFAPENEDVQLARAQLLNAKSQRSEALRHLEAYHETRAGRRSIGTLLAIAEIHRFEGNLTEASNALDRAEQMAPTDPKVILARLRWYAGQQRYDDMLARLAIRWDNVADESTVILTAASMLAYAEEARLLRESLNLFNRYIQLNPDSLDGLLGVAQVAQNLGDHRMAEEAYLRILDISPNHRETLNNFAWLLATELGQAEEGLRLANRGIDRYPEYPYLLDTRAMILLRLDRLDQARRDLEHCLSQPGIQPDTQASASLHLAEVSARQDNLDQARSFLEQATRLDRRHNCLSARQRAQAETLLQSLNQ